MPASSRSSRASSVCSTDSRFNQSPSTRQETTDDVFTHGTIKSVATNCSGMTGGETATEIQPSARSPQSVQDVCRSQQSHQGYPGTPAAAIERLLPPDLPLTSNPFSQAVNGAVPNAAPIEPIAQPLDQRAKPSWAQIEQLDGAAQQANKPMVSNEKSLLDNTSGNDADDYDDCRSAKSEVSDECDDPVLSTLGGRFTTVYPDKTENDKLSEKDRREWLVIPDPTNPDVVVDEQSVLPRGRDLYGNQLNFRNST